MAKQERLTPEVPDVIETPVEEVNGPEQPVAAKKLHWRVAAELKQMNLRRAQLLEKRAALTREIEELDAAILALE